MNAVIVKQIHSSTMGSFFFFLPKNQKQWLVFAKKPPKLKLPSWGCRTLLVAENPKCDHVTMGGERGSRQNFASRSFRFGFHCNLDGH